MGVMEFQIDPQQGSIALPNGLVITPDLTQEAFLALPQATEAYGFDCGTLPFIHYDLKCGNVADHPAHIRLSFYGSELLYVSVTLDLYPPGCRDWDHYNLDVEADTKRLHEELLKRMLGRPKEICRMRDRTYPESQQVLSTSLVWKYKWGSVGSGHDIKGGGTSIVVAYGDRLVKANRDYRLHHRLR